MWGFLMRIGFVAVLAGGVFAWYRMPNDYSSVFRKDDAGAAERVLQGDAAAAQRVEPVSASALSQKRSTTVDVPVAADIVPVRTTQDFFATLKDSVKQSVPFVVQAPRAQWDDPRYQDACEEASLLMAHAWLNGTGAIAKGDAETEMERMFLAEEAMFGANVIDTSVEDTAAFFRTHFQREVEVVRDTTVENMYRNLAEGAIIIVPTNGRALGNPNFTNGGPDRHMLIVIGYDKKAREFITNDPGTRVGKGYRYKDTVLYNAIRDYSTGHKEPILGTFKNVIVVRK